jgi:hypothetical protein
MKLGPFTPEFTVLRALDSHDEKLIHRAVTAYYQYVNTQVSSGYFPPAMKAHMRGFSTIICRQLPADEALNSQIAFHRLLR